ncbi:MAG TPA: TetR family transcriptional regulator [Streptosporangiaceae bacterium]|jgi:AcrR family transcriptional regulator
MDQRGGLRERKKERTRAAISDAAIALFVEEGFDDVSITRVAEAAEVSRRTLFAYFPTKEDLVVHRFADHETESARVVRGRPEGRAPLAALRAHFLDGLRRRDPITGLNDVPEIIALLRLVRTTRGLAARMLRFKQNGEQALSAALRDTAGVTDPTAGLAAAQIIAVQWTLAIDNQVAIAAGTTASAAYPTATKSAKQGFALLADGLGGVL